MLKWHDFILRIIKKLTRTSNLVSIVIPNFNNSYYISSCIDSVLQQSYRPIEIVIIDDNSTDNSIDIIESYQAKEIKLIKLKYNSGVSHCRNIGIKQARGEYLTTLDSDDILLSQYKLETEYELLKKHQEDNQDIIAFSNIVRLTESGKRIKVMGGDNILEGSIFEQIYKRACFIPRDFLCRREMYIKAGLYDQNIKMYEDWDLKLRLAADNEFYYTGKEGIGYRDRPEGLSKADNKEHEKWKAIVKTKNIKKAKKFFKPLC